MTSMAYRRPCGVSGASTHAACQGSSANIPVGTIVQLGAPASLSSTGAMTASPIQPVKASSAASQPSRSRRRPSYALA